MTTRRGAFRILPWLMAVITMFSLSGGCVPSDKGEKADAPDESAPATSSPTPEPTLNPEFIVEPPALIDDGRPETLPPQSEEITPGAAAPSVPARASVGDEYFEDAAFVGNSLVDGFRMFSGLTVCDYYATTSMTVMGVTDGSSIMQGLKQQVYGKIYVLLGINEIDFEPEYFKDLYREMLEKMMELQPDAIFYIMGLTPVSYNKSSSSPSFNMDRVRAYNTALFELAGEMGCYYLDLCEALSGDDGYLPADVTTDGVHFSASHYLVWLDYVRTHYITRDL